MNSIGIGRHIMQALKLSAGTVEATVLWKKTQKNKTKWLMGCFMTIVLWSLPSVAQEKNEVGLVIGGIVTPSQTLSPDANLIGPGATPLPSRDITFDSSLTLRAEYHREFVRRQEFAIDGGVDFLASPFDVKLTEKSQNAIGQYALIFVTPHVQVKFQPDGAFSP